MTDMEIVALAVARCQEEVEKVVGRIPDPGSIWGRSVMLAMKDVREARERTAEELGKSKSCDDRNPLKSEKSTERAMVPYLRDLAQRIRNIAAIHGVDGVDVDRLQRIASRIENVQRDKMLPCDDCKTLDLDEHKPDCSRFPF